MTRPTRYTCEEMFRRLNDYLDRSLGPEERRLVEEHLEGCAVCASEYRFETHVLEDVRTKLRRLDIPADLESRVARALKAARSEAEPT